MIAKYDLLAGAILTEYSHVASIAIKLIELHNAFNYFIKVCNKNIYFARIVFYS